MNDVKRISKRLSRVIDVALEVYKCRLLLKLAILCSLCNRVNYFVHICVSFSDVHIVTDTDNISHE